MERLNDSAIKPRKGFFVGGGSRFDMPFFLLTLLLLAIGLITVYSASYARSFEEVGNSTYYFNRQLIFAIGGVVAVLFITRINYQILRFCALPLLALSLVLLVLVLAVGTEHGGATRWLDIGFTEFQPSEVTKLAVIVSFAALISVYKEKMQSFRYGILPFLIILALIGTLMYFQPHISGIIIIFVTGGVLMFIGGANWKWFAAVIAALGGAGYFMATKLPHVQNRLAVWENPWIDPLGKGYQPIQAIYAMGSGGLLGLGLGNSRQKFMYLPEEFNDYIFAVWLEEMGYIGGLLVLLIFALFIIRGFWLAFHTRDRFGSLMISGIMTLFAAQVFFNIAVVTNLIPSTGISLPFFSYGGTALIIQLVEVGVVLAISRQNMVQRMG